MPSTHVPGGTITIFHCCTGWGVTVTATGGPSAVSCLAHPPLNTHIQNSNTTAAIRKYSHTSGPSGAVMKFPFKNFVLSFLCTSKIKKCSGKNKKFSGIKKQLLNFM
jgi:hypothetical protein